MTVTGELEFISTKTGTKKDGTPWYSGKFLDNEHDEFFTAFFDEELFRSLSKLQKHTPVLLTLNWVAGTKYYDISCIEVLKK